MLGITLLEKIAKDEQLQLQNSDLGPFCVVIKFDQSPGMDTMVVSGQPNPKETGHGLSYHHRAEKVNFQRSVRRSVLAGKGQLGLTPLFGHRSPRLRRPDHTSVRLLWPTLFPAAAATSALGWPLEARSGVGRMGLCLPQFSAAGGATVAGAYASGVVANDRSGDAAGRGGSGCVRRGERPGSVSTTRATLDPSRERSGLALVGPELALSHFALGDAAAVSTGATSVLGVGSVPLTGPVSTGRVCGAR